MTDSSHKLPLDMRRDLLRRLRRIEGQAQGIQRMVEQDRSCDAILDQLKSIRSATYGACIALMRYYARECMRRAEDEPSRDQTVEEMINLLLRLPH